MREMKSAKIGVRIIALLVSAVFVSIAIAQPVAITVCSTTGVVDENRVPLLGDGSSISDFVQLINAGSDGIINPPDGNGNPTGDDSLICEIRIGEGYPFEPDKGKFSHGLGLEVDTVIYCRAWNEASIEDATYYGDSITITVTEAVAYDFGTWSTDKEKSTPSPTASPSPSPTPTPTPTASPSPAQTETPIPGEPTPSLSPSPALTPAGSPSPISSPALTPAKPTPSPQTPAPAANEAPVATPVDVKVLISSFAISIVIALRRRKRYKNKT